MVTRRGYTLLELTVTCLILAAVLTVCMQLLSTAVAAQRASGQRQTAIEEATNAMERVYAIEFHELTSESARQLVPADRIAHTLPDGKLEITVDQPVQDPTSKRVLVAVSWRNRPEEPEKVVRLVAWKCRLARAEGGR